MDYREWQKRVSVVITVSGLVFLSFVGRLYQKSVVEHAVTVKAADEQYTTRQEVTGQRGDIVVKLDDNSIYPLATNEREYQVLVVPKNVQDPKHTAQALAHVLGQNETDIFNQINNQKLYIPPLQHRLTRQQADAIASLKLNGVLLLPELVRTYPEQTMAAQLLGFVNNDWQGSYGIEGTYDDILKGSTGIQITQRDNEGNLINRGNEIKPKNGATVTLTIDRDIQHLAEKALAQAVDQFKADSGSVIIVQPKTGAIVAMASVPTYNPNEFYKVPQDKISVFGDPVVSDVWEPGSIMKPIVVAIALDSKAVPPDFSGDFAASVNVAGHQIFTAEKKAFGHEDLAQILQNSDNVAMVAIADKLGNQKQYDGMKKFGFGSVPSLKLEGVDTGYLAPLKDWTDIVRATTSFGQGVSVTPLQMVMAYATLANKGVMMQPYLVDSVRDDTGIITQTKPKVLGKVVSEDTSNRLTDMLQSVVELGLGKRAQVSGYRIGGKTGTAQVPDPKGGYYDDRHIGSFAGYFPLSNPQYAMVVKLDNPKTVNFAESSAGPTFGDIARAIIQVKQIPPDKPQPSPSP